MSDDRASIRRRRAVLAVALAAFAAGAIVGGASEHGEHRTTSPAPRGRAAPRPAPARLPLGRQVGQLVVLRFAGPRPPAYVLRALRDGRAAGVILFADNVTGPAQLRALTRRLRRAGGRPIIALDQEGGDVRIIPWAPPDRTAPGQAAAGSVGRDARAAAGALHALGVTVALAPVADVPSVARAATAGRAFSRDPRAAATAVREAVAGWRAGGVAPTAKHFPGLGGTAVNTDLGPATVRRSRAELERADLAPFRAAIAAGVPLVMVGHARYPALDPRRIASQSRPIIAGLLRDRLGFHGVVVTDSMEARASLATGSITTVAERAVRAGADLVLLTGRGSYIHVYRHLLAVARRSRGFRARVRRSARRVLGLRARTAHL